MFFLPMKCTATKYNLLDLKKHAAFVSSSTATCYKRLKEPIFSKYNYKKKTEIKGKPAILWCIEGDEKK